MNTVKQPTLDVGEYDPISDTIEIAGTRYAGDLFRCLGCDYPEWVGQTVRIESKEDGVVFLTNVGLSS